MTEIVLQTWNCFGAAQSLRSALSWRGVVDAHRLDHPEVKREVAAADIVCMQEVFLGDAEAFFDGLEHPHKLRDDNRATLWPLTVGGSGLAVASKLPFSSRAVRPFSRPHVGAERFARKGLLHVRVEIEDGVELDLVTTHMQSGYDDGARRVRERQLTELREAVDTLGAEDRAFVVAGDLNICGLAEGRADEYATIRSVLPDFTDLGADDDAPTFHPHPEVNSLAHRFESSSPKQRVDYVLFRPAARGGPTPLGCELALSDRLEGHGPTTFASDHFAVRVRLGL
jgi:endonuclease/exonuclease/phosphatase family metal-dependent hydrolase